MSILVKGWDMPDDCKTCDFCHYDGFIGFCFANDEKIADEGRREDCPLTEVPTPHGRLIDADKMEKATTPTTVITKVIKSMRFDITPPI